MFFSILKSGMPVVHQPAGFGVLLEQVHVVTGAGELLGAGHAAGPEPTTAIVLPVLCGAGCGMTQRHLKARSAIAHSMVLIATGLLSMLSVQDASHGAGQTRPVTSGKLLVECRLRAASSQLPL